MKKYCVLTACFLMFALVGLSGNAFAANGDNTASGELVIGSTSSTPLLTIGLSPKVSARYVTDGTTTVSAQWYAIGTVHPGGNVGYGTAQNLNNIYSQDYATGSAVADVLGDIPSTPNSADDWSGAIWDM